VKSNRSALGAIVRVTSASGTQTQTVRSGSSYCSQSELTLTFGLGTDSQISTVEILWPSGTRQQLRGVAVNRQVTIVEGQAP
jgi:hypothetical protein